MADHETRYLVEATGLVKTYGVTEQATRALEGVDLRLAHGEFVSLMGPSGSGKSTLLNLIAGLDTPDGGSVVIDGMHLQALSDRQLSNWRLRRVGFIFQSFNLISALTVEENVSWPMDFARYRRQEVRNRTAEALRRTGVSGRERRYPTELSGGEQQRVAIARAIATRPALLLADEPTGNLDSVTGRMILDLLRTVNRSDGTTVLMVTHNVFAASYGDRTLEMCDGRIIREARMPPREDDEPAIDHGGF